MLDVENMGWLVRNYITTIGWEIWYKKVGRDMENILMGLICMEKIGYKIVKK
jgi:hypothetical protein